MLRSSVVPKSDRHISIGGVGIDVIPLRSSDTPKGDRHPDPVPHVCAE
ncbi:hypothetical protein LO772_16190 [Yinghuangia sp. ASG 101]|nr:hypothetical protein [Yinghuangia sp. ASG 101]UGQ14967.1 hypothetical protein LO772_16190 [Yinghuangia sp. ASG 101]